VRVRTRALLAKPYAHHDGRVASLERLQLRAGVSTRFVLELRYSRKMRRVRVFGGTTLLDFLKCRVLLNTRKLNNYSSMSIEYSSINFMPILGTILTTCAHIRAYNRKSQKDS